MHADWILAAAMLPNGPRPHLYFIAVPAEQTIVVDTWHMDGMIGTGSNDIVMRDVFVPAHRVIDMKEMQDGTAPGCKLHTNPLYRMPMLPFLAVAAAIPAVGTARQAVRLFRERLSRRVIVGTETDPGRKARSPDAAGQSPRAHDYSRDDDPAGGERELRAGRKEPRPRTPTSASSCDAVSPTPSNSRARRCKPYRRPPAQALIPWTIRSSARFATSIRCRVTWCTISTRCSSSKAARW